MMKDVQFSCIQKVTIRESSFNITTGGGGGGGGG